MKEFTSCIEFFLPSELQDEECVDAAFRYASAPVHELGLVTTGLGVFPVRICLFPLRMWICSLAEPRDSSSAVTPANPGLSCRRGIICQADLNQIRTFKILKLTKL